MLQRGLIQLADAAVRTDDEGKRKRVPVAVGVGCFVQCWIGMKCAPVFAVVGGDVGAVGADGDPGFGGGVVGYGGAVAVGWGCGGVPVFCRRRSNNAAVPEESSGFDVVAADSHCDSS